MKSRTCCFWIDFTSSVVLGAEDKLLVAVLLACDVWVGGVVAAFVVVGGKLGADPALDTDSPFAVDVGVFDVSFERFRGDEFNAELWEELTVALDVGDLAECRDDEFKLSWEEGFDAGALWDLLTEDFGGSSSSSELQLLPISSIVILLSGLDDCNQRHLSTKETSSLSITPILTWPWT